MTLKSPILSTSTEGWSTYSQVLPYTTSGRLGGDTVEREERFEPSNFYTDLIMNEGGNDVKTARGRPKPTK